MTDAERRIYDRMSPREQRAVDAHCPEMQSLTITLWEHAQKRRREGPPDESWKTRPRRETVDDDGRFGP